MLNFNLLRNFFFFENVTSLCLAKLIKQATYTYTADYDPHIVRKGRGGIVKVTSNQLKLRYVKAKSIH